MSIELLAALYAGLPFVIASFFTALERRTRSVAHLSPPSFLRDSGGERFGIVSARARCVCGHARERHAEEALPCCGCRDYEYAGGLANETDSSLIEQARPAQITLDAAGATRSSSHRRVTVVVLALTVPLLAHAVLWETARAESGTFRVHVVEPGDTLSAIADQSGQTVEELIEVNQISEPNRLLPGTPLVLKMGSRASATSGPIAAASTTYRVQPGDTLSAIADELNTDTQTIAGLNELIDENDIRAGMLLDVPGIAEAPVPSESRQHVVQAGETLSDIAASYGLDHTTLARANQLRNPHLVRAGTLLHVPLRRLPSPPASVASAVVKAAAEHGTDPYLVLALSYLESGWQMGVVSRTGAVGVMQLMPETGWWVSTELIGAPMNWRSSLTDNVRVGTTYLDHLLTIANGDTNAALAAYYQGWASVERSGRYRDTEQYVDDVRALVDSFRARGSLG